MSACIRLARDSDADAIAAVHGESWRLTYARVLSARYLAGLEGPQLTATWRRRLRDRRGASTLVAEENGEVIGFARHAPCTGDADLAGFAGEIEMLYVHPRAQGRGHGQALFDHAAADLSARPLFWLVVWVVAANRPARVFYHRMGLRPDGARRTDRIDGGSVPVVRYAGALNLLTW